MWLFTRHGFYSVTRSTKEPDKLQVRARTRGDLENLAGFLITRDQPTCILLGRDMEIIETPAADYRYRWIVEPGDWLIISVELMADIQYHNFKDQIKDHERHNDYLGVWSIMNGVQRRHVYDARQTSYIDGYEYEPESDPWGGDVEADSYFDNITDFGDPQDDWDPASFFWRD